MKKFILFSIPLTLLLVCGAQAANIGQDGFSDRVIVSDAAGTARWAVDASSAAGFGDGLEEDAVLFGSFSDLHFLGDMNGDGLVDKVRVSDAGGAWRIGWDLSTPTSFGDGVEDPGAFLFGGPASHEVVGVGDIDGDGQADVVLRDGSATWLATLNLNGTPDLFATLGATSHEIIGLADINGNGQADRVINTSSPGGLFWQADFSTGGVMGDGGPDTAAGFGAVSFVKLLGDLNNDGFGDRVVVIDPLGTPNWQGDFSPGGVFGDGASDFFQAAGFGVAGDEFLLADVVTNIPEPTSILLLSMGGFFALFRSNRNRK